LPEVSASAISRARSAGMERVSSSAASLQTCATALPATSARITVRSSISAIGLSRSTRMIDCAGSHRSAVDGTEHRVREHHDLVGGERDQRAAGHRHVRHEHGDARLVTAQRARDLQGRGHLAAGRVQDDVERPVGPAWWMARMTASESSRSI